MPRKRSRKFIERMEKRRITKKQVRLGIAMQAPLDMETEDDDSAGKADEKDKPASEE